MLDIKVKLQVTYLSFYIEFSIQMHDCINLFLSLQSYMLLLVFCIKDM